GSHNFPLEVLHASGIVGFGAWVILHAVIAVGTFRQLRRAELTDSDRNALLGLTCAVIAIVSASFSNLIFWNPTYWMLLGVLLGAGECMRIPLKARGRSEQNMLREPYAAQQWS